ncbi:MAG: hypothetical protein L3J83_08795 [Proteobacteria bacterium]|nr:hypothetical protein [Pseudomonadota bacterium]
MRIETNYIFLIYFIIALILILALVKTKLPSKPFKILLAFMVALTMPAFIPGHGEIIMLIPSGTLFSVASLEVKTIGVIFAAINYFVAWTILYKVLGLFKN